MSLDEIKFDENGLIPAIVQDADSGEVLMLAYMNEQSLKKTLETSTTWFYSRSRKKLWNKGETSGHFQQVQDIRIDCDQDTLLLFVHQQGAACHTGSRSCFYRGLDGVQAPLPQKGKFILDELFEVVEDRKQNPKEDSYTNYLLDCGIDKILKKVGEECAETIIAAKNASKEEIALETSDLLYHLIVMLSERGLRAEDIYSELKKRR
ncbi:MAG: bifunctional phosphoribosyl-AMP cyclohydrolase/phosphoribosyl-ATP diphosphatase HisIE [Clostridia bacterium]|nr:bifunctional phosphoribosyl-AMP cyclohydrolase/phosphoribosyl-ATP diphosphatase HisIE [Clostridia bacterium]